MSCRAEPLQPLWPFGMSCLELVDRNLYLPDLADWTGGHDCTGKAILVEVPVGVVLRRGHVIKSFAGKNPGRMCDGNVVARLVFPAEHVDGPEIAVYGR